MVGPVEAERGDADVPQLRPEPSEVQGRLGHARTVEVDEPDTLAVEEHLRRPEVVVRRDGGIGNGLLRQLGEPGQQRPSRRGQGGHTAREAVDDLADLVQLLPERGGPPVRRTGAVHRGEGASGRRQGCPQLLEQVRVPLGDRPPGQVLERAVLRHRSLHQDPLVRQVTERLGQPHGVRPRTWVLPEHVHGLPRRLALLPLVGLQHHPVRRHPVDGSTVVAEAYDDGAAAARLVAHHDGLAGRDRDVAVARLLQDLFEQPGRLRRIDQPRQGRERVVGGLYPQVQARVGRGAPPPRLTEVDVRFGGRRRRLPAGWPQVPDEHDLARHAVRLLDGEGVARQPLVSLRAEPVGRAPQQPDPPVAQLGDVPLQRSMDPAWVHARGQPVRQLPEGGQ